MLQTPHQHYNFVDRCKNSRTSKVNMFLVAFVLLLLTEINAKKDLLRVTNNSSIHNSDNEFIGVPFTHLKPRRLALTHLWVLNTEQSIKPKSDGWEMYMSMSLPTSSSIASPSSSPARSPTSSTLAPSYKSINVGTSSPAKFSSIAPSGNNATPNNTTIVPSHTPQPSQADVPSLTQFPTNRKPTISVDPTSISGPASSAPSLLVMPMFAESAVPSGSESRNDSAAAPTTSGMPFAEQLRESSEPSSAIKVDDAIFECRSNKIIGISLQSDRPSTKLTFTLEYSVESSFNESEYLEDLEKQILVTAVAGALQCQSSGAFLTDDILEMTERSNQVGVIMNTTSIDESCPSKPISPCIIFKTEFQAIVNGILDAEASQVLGYLLIRDKMDDGTFVKVIPNVDRCQYLKPLPLLPPVGKGDNSNEQIDQEETDRLSVSPWSLATLSLLCAFGVVVIAALYRQRARRIHRHMELGEDMSVGSQLQS